MQVPQQGDFSGQGGWWFEYTTQSIGEPVQDKKLFNL